MTKEQAANWVRTHTDDDEFDDVELADAFSAIYERKPDDTDWEQGLWSHLCASVETI